MRAEIAEYLEAQEMGVVSDEMSLSEFPTGAVRSTDAQGVRYDLITPVASSRRFSSPYFLSQSEHKSSTR